MKFRPLHDRVVVKRIDAEEKTSWRHHHPGHVPRKSPRKAKSPRSAPAAVTKPAS